MNVLFRELATPALSSFVPPHIEGVFDAFSWTTSDVLTWGVPVVGALDAPRFDLTTRVERADPKRLLFVMQKPCAYLPRELARLHLFDMGFDDEWALSPCAIDEATDQLYEHNERPRELLWLAADNIAALFWGLHDWAHFHNHGAFEQRAWTEYHCDQSALTWLQMNQDAIGLTAEILERIHKDVHKINHERFAEEGTDHEKS